MRGDRPASAPRGARAPNWQRLAKRTFRARDGRIYRLLFEDILDEAERKRAKWSWIKTNQPQLATMMPDLVRTFDTAEPVIRQEVVGGNEGTQGDRRGGPGGLDRIQEHAPSR